MNYTVSMYSGGETTKDIAFDQVIDTSTLDEATFSLTYPAPAQVIGANQLISGAPAPSTVNVHGAWSFATNSSNQTVATFTPERPFGQNTPYTAMLLGSDAALTSADIQNQAGESMAVSYSWGFTSGVLALKTRSLHPAGNKTPARGRAKDVPAETNAHFSGIGISFQQGSLQKGNGSQNTA